MQQQNLVWCRNPDVHRLVSVITTLVILEWGLYQSKHTQSLPSNQGQSLYICIYRCTLNGRRYNLSHVAFPPGLNNLWPLHAIIGSVTAEKAASACVLLVQGGVQEAHQNEAVGHDGRRRKRTQAGRLRTDRCRTSLSTGLWSLQRTHT